MKYIKDEDAIRSVFASATHPEPANRLTVRHVMLIFCEVLQCGDETLMICLVLLQGMLELGRTAENCCCALQVHGAGDKYHHEVWAVSRLVVEFLNVKSKPNLSNRDEVLPLRCSR